MYEKLKTTVLTLLVLLSIILTWQLWTFQPDYAVLEQTETDYVENVLISEEKKLKEIIWPEQIAIHKNGGISLLEQVNPLFDQLYKQLLQSHLTQIVMVETIAQPDSFDDAIELIFPTGIPSQLLLSMFESPDETNTSLQKIERIILYVNKKSEKVHMQLISYREQQAIDATTTLSVKDFYQDYVSKMNQLPMGFAYEMSEEGQLLRPPLYLPTNEVTYQAVSYTTTPIFINAFTQLFFTDPSSVRYFRQEDSDELYTDGNRMINVSYNGNFMDYINPVYSDAQERSQKHVISNSIDFINGHGGWTDRYVLDHWMSIGVKEEASYRLNLNGLPVILFSGQDLMRLEVSRTGNQISRYMRPLVDFDYYLVDVNKEVKLPSGKAVIERLKENDYFSLEKLEKITVGYEAQKRNALIVAEPSWFILYDGYWQKVSFEIRDREGEKNGLE
ncbi:MAG TPA: hypothetical protein GX525_01900 [Bacilli bacterium]|nr:hypothetical protein [Bacilli bacterium]